MLNFSITEKAFFEQYYERAIYLQRNAFLSDISWKEINKILHAIQSTPDHIRLHNGKNMIAESEYLEDHLHVELRSKRFRKESLYTHLHDGATLILNRMETLSVPIKRYCDVISRFVGAPVVANGYAAFGEKESFGKHWDTHDVFAVQLIGRKRWRIYAPTFPLPMQHQTSRDHKQDCPVGPVFDDYLHSGDVLYIPRGWWHTAIPSNEETFHIAVGVHPARVAHYALWVCQHLLPNFLQSRYSLNRFSNDRDALESTAAHFQELLLNPDHLHKFKVTLAQYNTVGEEFALPIILDDFDVNEICKSNA